MLEEEKSVGGLKKIILEMSKHLKISVWRVLDTQPDPIYTLFVFQIIGYWLFLKVSFLVCFPVPVPGCLDLQ